ncbi:hypothetical protein NMD75_11135 [Edwardsiella tarda]
MLRIAHFFLCAIASWWLSEAQSPWRIVLFYLQRAAICITANYCNQDKYRASPPTAGGIFSERTIGEASVDKAKWRIADGGHLLLNYAPLIETPYIRYV